MRAGLLRERITIYRPTITSNGYGEQLTTEVLLCSTRARIMRNNRQRENVDGELALTADLTMQIRSYHQPMQNDVVVYRGTKYRIFRVSYLDQENCIELNLQAMESDNNLTPTPTPEPTEPTEPTEPEENENTEENNG